MVTTNSSAETAGLIKKLLKPSPDDRADASRLDELRKLFAKLIRDGELDLSSTKKDGSSVRQKWNDFLRTSHKRFVCQLCERISAGKRTAVRTMWGVVATSPLKSASKSYDFVSIELLQHWVRAMTTVPSMDKSIRTMLQAEFIHPNRDIQYYTMIAIALVANELYEQQQNGSKKKKTHMPVEERAERLVDMLMMIPIPSTQRELEEKGEVLFPPPANAVPDEEDKPEEESDEDEDEDESDEESDDGSDEDSAAEESPRKRIKLEPAKKLFAFQEIRNHHRVWSKAWLAVLRLALPPAALKQALRFLPEMVLPHISHPLRFADFFMNAYNNTGVIPLLALDGLFLLVTHHGLEYPNFYKQLYCLVTPSLLYVKYRTRFFRLIDKCLSRNEMLPAHVVAAFVKRLIRCTLTAPPSSTLFVLALCSNLLRKHPEISCLVHRDEKTDIEDKFDAETDDPEQANALQSSLWELGALERHYFPAVATMAKSVGREQELSAPLHDMEDFLVHTYQSFFEQERKRKQRRGKVPLTFSRPSSLFSGKDVFSGILALPKDKTNEDNE